MKNMNRLCLGASGYRTNSELSYVDGIPVHVFYPEGQRQPEPVYEGPRYYTLTRQPDPPIRQRRRRRTVSDQCENISSEFVTTPEDANDLGLD